MSATRSRANLHNLYAKHIDWLQFWSEKFNCALSSKVVEYMYDYICYKRYNRWKINLK